MNRILQDMVEIQLYWDKILNAEAEIKRNEEVIRTDEKRLKDALHGLSHFEAELKKRKALIHEKEIELAAKDEHKRKLEKKREVLRTEREINALTLEQEKVNAERGVMEEELILEMDAISLEDKKLILEKKKFQEQQKLLEEEKIKLDKKNLDAGNIKKENQEKFSGKFTELNVNYQEKFMNYLKTRNGKGIVILEGNVCSGCNSSIPVHIAKSVAENVKIINCPNCSRFLYCKD